MRFRLESKARNYFENINKNSNSGKVKTRLEYYWLCALIGMVFDAYNKDLVDDIDLFDKFTAKLKAYEFEIRSLIFYKYIQKNFREQFLFSKKDCHSGIH